MIRVLHSGNAAYENDFTFFRSEIFFTPSLFAVFVSIVKVSLSTNGVCLSSVRPCFCSYVFAALYVAAADGGNFFDPARSSTMIPVYSG